MSYDYSDFLTWSATLEDWQRDALRRILTKESLDHPDIVELADIAIDDQCNDGPTAAVVADLTHIPVAGSSAETVNLLAIKDIENVNALGAGPVFFGPDGLTVVYGRTGTGKSGIARILKSACNSRSGGDPILTNVHASPTSNTPRAEIKFTNSGVDDSTGWEDGQPKNAQLENVNIYDSRAADIQIESANKITYSPHILTVFTDLARAIIEVRTELERRLESIPVDSNLSKSLGLSDKSAARTYVDSLKHDSKVSELESLAQLSEKELDRYSQINVALASNHPNAAQVEDAFASRLDTLASLETRVSDWFSKTHLTEIQTQIAKTSVTKIAATAAAGTLSQISELEGVGSDTWKSLWESARAYSETSAYAQREFPHTGEESKCVLCHQDLASNAKQRLGSFEEFVQSDLVVKSNLEIMNLAEIQTELETIVLPSNPEAVLSDAGLADETAVAPVLEYFESVGSQIAMVKKAIAEVNDAELISTLTPTPNFGAMAIARRTTAATIRSAANTKERKDLVEESAAINDRKILGQNIKVVTGQISRSAERNCISDAIATAMTNKTTLQHRTASDQVITSRLKSNLTSNLQEIGFNGMPVEVVLGQGSPGEHPYAIQLQADAKVSPSSVLSEGERTCVAISGFLSELETMGNSSSIVLDDPVDSLDQQYRLRVAMRLVRESKSRQVIVFTHDIIFVHDLISAADSAGENISQFYVEGGVKSEFGKYIEGPPPIALPVKKRIGQMRDILAKATRLRNEGDLKGYNTKAEEIYMILRQSWERAVEEVLLNNTVVRFGNSVQTQRLSKLTDITDADATLVDANMSYCSGFVHDSSAYLDVDPPPPETITVDINKLSDWVVDLRKNRSRS